MGLTANQSAVIDHPAGQPIRNPPLAELCLHSTCQAIPYLSWHSATIVSLAWIASINYVPIGSGTYLRG